MLNEISDNAKMTTCPVCLRKHYPHCSTYQRKQTVFLWLSVALVVAALVALPAKAQQVNGDSPTVVPQEAPFLIERPSVYLNENGVMVLNSVFDMVCDPANSDIYITIKVTFVSRTVDYLTSQYCGVTIYIVGDVELAEVFGVMAAPPEPVEIHRVWLPVVSK